MRNHGDRSLGEARGKERIIAQDGSERLQSGADNEPWSFGAKTEKIIEKYINIREVLRSYMRDLFNEAHISGQPIVRGLFYEFSGDSFAHEVKDEYMLGSDLLVAPITERGATSRDVYLPGDSSVTWISMHDGSKYVGNETVSVAAPDDVIPVFARDGNDHGLLRLI
jgi:alpha-D-xyloside xylohydrolase